MNTCTARIVLTLRLPQSLIDLAGSEKATSDKERTREGKYINTRRVTDIKNPSSGAQLNAYMQFINLGLCHRDSRR